MYVTLTDLFNPRFRVTHVQSEESYETSKFEKLNEVRTLNPNRLIIVYVNINSLRNKFEMLQTIIIGKVDISLITETKLDNFFPSN